MSKKIDLPTREHINSLINDELDFWPVLNELIELDHPVLTHSVDMLINSHDLRIRALKFIDVVLEHSHKGKNKNGN